MTFSFFKIIYDIISYFLNKKYNKPKGISYYLLKNSPTTNFFINLVVVLFFYSIIDFNKESLKKEPLMMMVQKVSALSLVNYL